jgi:hypothetical protein
LQAIRMSNLENYRSSSDYREILRILQKASSLQENFLWQSHALGRSIIPIHHFEIDFVTREVVIYFDTQNFKVNADLPLYVKLDYRTSVFKISDFRSDLNSVHFAFPTEIKTLELREFPRIQFLPNQDKSVGLKPSLSGGRETGNELFVRALDVSRYGLGLIISEQNRSFLKNNRILWITKLGEEHLDRPILAEVVYMNSEIDSRFLVRKQKELKVGLKISGAFPSEAYKHFIQ